MRAILVVNEDSENSKYDCHIYKAADKMIFEM